MQMQRTPITKYECNECKLTIEGTKEETVSPLVQAHINSVHGGNTPTPR
jgi:hypothetical protein